MTALSLILSSIMAFHPTIDGAREDLPYIQAEVPYVLGISVPPPGSVNLRIEQGEVIWQGTAMGTFTIQTITSSEPILFYEDDVYVGQIVPEPASICLWGVLIPLMCRRKRKG